MNLRRESTAVANKKGEFEAQAQLVVGGHSVDFMQRFRFSCGNATFSLGIAGGWP